MLGHETLNNLIKTKCTEAAKYRRKAQHQGEQAPKLFLTRKNERKKNNLIEQTKPLPHVKSDRTKYGLLSNTTHGISALVQWIARARGGNSQLRTGISISSNRLGASEGTAAIFAVNLRTMKEILRTTSRSWLYPVLALIAVNFIYFAPVVFQSKQIPQDDIKLGIAKGKEIVDYRAETGDEPLWTNAMFSGMPTFQMSTIYPNNVLQYVATSFTALGASSSVYIVALLMLGFFFLLRGEKVDPWLSVAGAVAFGFSAFFIISLAAGHNAKIRTAAYMAPLVLGVLLTYRGRTALGFFVAALATGLSIQSNHFQITYYTAIPVLAVSVAYLVAAVREGALKQWVLRSLLLLGAAVVGIGPNIGNLWSTYAYTKATMRGGHSDLTPIADSTAAPAAKAEGLDFDYAMSWSYGDRKSVV